MLMIAADNRRYDMGIVFDFGKVLTKVNSLIKNGSTSFVSTIESIRAAVQSDIDAYAALTEEIK